MSKRLEELNGTLKARCEALVEAMDKADGETSPTAEELKSYQESVSTLETEIKGLHAQIDAEEANEKSRASALATIERLGRPVTSMQHSGVPGYVLAPDGTLKPPGAALKTFGADFVETPAYKTWIANHAPAGVLPSRGGGGPLPDSSPVPLGRALKSIVTGLSTWAQPGDTSGSALVQPVFRGIVDEGVWMIPDLGIADIVTHEPTTADVIFYVKVSNGTQAAAPTAEATASDDGSGAKPEGELTFTQASALVHTIPVWVPVTRQALAVSAQLQGIIDRYLRYEVQRELTKQIIQGDGTGENFLGVEHLPAILAQAFVTDRLVTARKAITNLLLNGRTVPTAWAMYPTDWELFDLETDNEARYYFGGPRSPGVPTLWGVPVRQSEFVTVLRPILGDWRRYVVADREQTTVRVSDSHADFFVRNLMAVLAEMRAAGYAERDQAFVRLAALPSS